MLCKIDLVGKSDSRLEEYFVEAKSINEASQKARKKAEKEYPEEKPITIVSIDVLSLDPVVR